jgi:hypothetical protein
MQYHFYLILIKYIHFIFTPNGWRLSRLAVFRIVMTILAGNLQSQSGVLSLSLGQSLAPPS